MVALGLLELGHADGQITLLLELPHTHGLLFGVEVFDHGVFAPQRSDGRNLFGVLLGFVEEIVQSLNSELSSVVLRVEGGGKAVLEIGNHIGSL